MDWKNYMESMAVCRMLDRICNAAMYSSSGFALGVLVALFCNKDTLIKIAGTSLFIVLIALVTALYQRRRDKDPDFPS